MIAPFSSFMNNVRDRGEICAFGNGFVNMTSITGKGMHQTILTEITFVYLSGMNAPDFVDLATLYTLPKSAYVDLYEIEVFFSVFMCCGGLLTSVDHPDAA